MTGGKIIQIFQDADLRCSHDGLADLAKKEKVDIQSLAEGEYVVFFNAKRTHLKIAAAHGVIAHRKIENGRFYDVSCIQMVVRAFHNTGRVDYDEGLREWLVDHLRKKKNLK